MGRAYFLVLALLVLHLHLNLHREGGVRNEAQEIDGFLVIPQDVLVANEVG